MQILWFILNAAGAVTNDICYYSNYSILKYVRGWYIVLVIIIIILQKITAFRLLALRQSQKKKLSTILENVDSQENDE